MAFTAFINASLTTARGQNDTHPQLLTHIGCIVIPAVLALAEMGEAPDQLVLYALLVGHESIPRISRSLAEQNTLREFRAASLCASLGAALACSVVLRLSALPIATNLASGRIDRALKLQSRADHHRTGKAFIPSTHFSWTGNRR